MPVLNTNYHRLLRRTLQQVQIIWQRNWTINNHVTYPSKNKQYDYEIQ